MADFTPYEFELRDGWPPDGEPGLFFGFDASMNCAVLQWVKDNWRGIRWQFDLLPPMPQAFMRGEGTQDFVVKHARAPHRWTADDAGSSGQERVA